LTMIIDLSSLGRDPKPVELEFAAGQIDLDESAELIEASLKGEVNKDAAERAHLKGHIDADVKMACGRCLETIDKHLEIDFEDIFVDSSREPDADEIQLESSDLDESLVPDGQIDLAEVVREQLILQTDEPVVCQEDCLGLCPKCGGNRNLIDCRCEENEIDPRWAALKNLN